jgi:hypothetical protein
MYVYLFCTVFLKINICFRILTHIKTQVLALRLAILSIVYNLTRWPLYCYHNTHTYHSRFIPKGVAEPSQIFLRDAHVLPIAMRNADVTGGKPIAA